jgi:hypothetical protein
MKKNLLFVSALALSLSAFSQSGNRPSANRHIFEGAKLVEDKRFENRFIRHQNMDRTDATNAGKIGPVMSNVADQSNTNSNAASSAPILSTSFYKLSGSMNVFGMLVSASKPLNYQRILGCVTWTQRKCTGYLTSPPSLGNSGTIVSFIGKNDAVTNSTASWDSTCLWANASNLGRYPVGGLWNTVPGNGNIDPDKAYAVGMGPITNGTTWIGSWYASKSLSITPKNAPGAVAGDQQFFSDSPPTFNTPQSAQMTKHDFPRYGFNITDQAVWVAGQKQNNIEGTTNSDYGLRGASITKGTFNSGIMVWSMDSLIPPVYKRSDSSRLVGEPYMKFTPNGQLGYAMMLGVRQGIPAGSSNRGMQPIVYKTTDGGNVWNIVNGIDFNASTPAIDRIKNTMRSVGGLTTQVEAPWFWSEGIDMAIDASGKLHILATVIGHASAHVDSMNYLSTWTTEEYHWPHVNTARPLIVDYSGDGVGSWNALIIDSLDTEGPGELAADGGYGSNPWARPTVDESVSSDARLQITSSYDGQFLAYSWAESDTGLTTNNVKWNMFPNVKVRGYRTCDGSLSPDVFIITGQTSTPASVKDHAFFHYMSGEMKAGASTVNSATFAIPFTISNNPQTYGIDPVTNYFAMSHLQFAFPSAACGATVTTAVGNVRTEAMESSIFPNPTENDFSVRLSLTETSDISVAVYNALGQKVAGSKANGNIGENTVPVNMNNVSAGIYFVKINVGKNETTKKLVVK